MKLRPPWWKLAAGVFLFTAGLTLWFYQGIVSLAPLALLLAASGWIAFWSIAAFGAGSPFFLSLREVELYARIPLTLVLGAAVLVMFGLALGFAGLLRPWILLALLVAFAAVGCRQLIQLRRAVGALPASPSPLWWVVVAVGFFSFLAATTPSSFYDQLNYHLAFPFHWLRQGRMFLFPRHHYSFFPLNMSVLYAYALAMLPVWAAQVLHWWMGAVTVLAVGALARLLRGNGAWAAVIIASTPAAFLTSTLAGSDLGVAAFAAAAWLTVVLAVRRDRGWLLWLLAGTLAGLAAGCKLIGLVIVVAPLGFCILLSPAFLPTNGSFWAETTRRTVWYGLGVSLTLAPWLVRNALATGNPVFPLLSSSAVGGGNAYWQGEAFFGGGRTFGEFLLYQLKAFLLGTFAPAEVAGFVGPVYLMLLPVVFFAVWRRGKREAALLFVGFVFAVLGWSLLPPVPPLPRFLLGGLVLAASLGGFAWEEFTSFWSRHVRRWLDLLLAVGLVWGFFAGLTPEVVMRWGVSLGQLDPEQWMTNTVDYWSAAQYVNKQLPSNVRVLLVAEARSMYLEREVEVEDPFQKPLLCHLADTLPSAEAMAQRLAAMGITHCLVNWKEARRMAALNHRGDYFFTSSEQGRRNLKEFFQRWLVPVFRHEHVEVYVLRSS